jgi:hypothetical protein
MKIYRIVTLFAAVLITVSLAGVLSHERVGDLGPQSPITVVGTP